MGYEELKIEGRNAVLEAFRSGKTIDKLFVLDGCQDGPVRTIVREAKKHDTIVHFVEKERLDQLSETKKHQGVIAVAAAYEYAEVEDMLKLAEEKGEPPFLFILDNIEDPHNLGAIIRTANLAGAHGVIIPKRRVFIIDPAVHNTDEYSLSSQRERRRLCRIDTGYPSSHICLKIQALWLLDKFNLGQSCQIFQTFFLYNDYCVTVQKFGH